MVFRARIRDLVAALATVEWTQATARVLRIAKDRPPFEDNSYRLYQKYLAIDLGRGSVLVPLASPQEFKTLLTVLGMCATLGEGVKQYDKRGNAVRSCDSGKNTQGIGNTPA